jgi:hypothetical protein
MLPSAETAALLFWALLASGQITMRKVNGCESLAELRHVGAARQSAAYLRAAARHRPDLRPASAGIGTADRSSGSQSVASET